MEEIRLEPAEMAVIVVKLEALNPMEYTSCTFHARRHEERAFWRGESQCFRFEGKSRETYRINTGDILMITFKLGNGHKYPVVLTGFRFELPGNAEDSYRIHCCSHSIAAVPENGLSIDGVQETFSSFGGHTLGATVSHLPQSASPRCSPDAMLVDHPSYSGLPPTPALFLWQLGCDL